jgi:ubiquitin-protein ligase
VPLYIQFPQRYPRNAPRLESVRKRGHLDFFRSICPPLIELAPQTVGPQYSSTLSSLPRG